MLNMSQMRTPITRPTDPDGLVLEAWGQGLMIGSLLIMAAVTLANMKRHLLHKLIIAELLLAMPHGVFIFLKGPVYGWYLSVSAIGLNMSWTLHNVISWMKNRPFLSRKMSLCYIGSVLLVQPYWVLEIYANFTYFNNINKIFLTTRPLEPLFRDPWWIFTTCSLFYNIKLGYRFSVLGLIRMSPRFGIMLVSMFISIIFIVVDILSVLRVLNSTSLPTGVQPFWKISFIFKCLCDTIILDDFETMLNQLQSHLFQRQVRTLYSGQSYEANAANHPRASLWEGGYVVQLGPRAPHPLPAYSGPSSNSVPRAYGAS